ncbi:hypothetical protein GGR61_000556 [Xanthomonas arboricola]|nr:hypothetical protein [Xanthomonas sp. 3058]
MAACSREAKATVEHVFGTLKAWLGTTPLLTKTLPKVRTEIRLAVLAYNMKCMIKIAGTLSTRRAPCHAAPQLDSRRRKR